MIQTHARILLEGYRILLEQYRTTPVFKDVAFLTVPTQAEAPQSLGELRQSVAAGTLPVALEHGDTSIYGSAVANATFRMMHDAGHVIYGKEMTYYDEVVLACLQWEDLYPVFRDLGANNDLLWQLERLYLADTVGQSHYCHRAGGFPKDQRRFVRTLLDLGGDRYTIENVVDMMMNLRLYEENPDA